MNPIECDFCKGSPIPGVCFPTEFDDREPSRDGRVWIARHDECGIFDGDHSAAEAVSRVTGWPVQWSYDRDDDLDPVARLQAKFFDYRRPYFAVTLDQATYLMARNLPLEDKNYPMSDWRHEVANEDTVLGYVAWVEHKYEAKIRGEE